jgi:hypothetical protein
MSWRERATAVKPSWRDRAQPVDQKQALERRVGPPTLGEEAVLKDIPALSGLGYGASQVPLAGPLAERAGVATAKFFGDDKAQEKMDLGKARYEMENPKTADVLKVAAPFALPLGPAKAGAQALYQGGLSAADTLARGGDAGDAGLSGALSAGVSRGLTGVAARAAPYIKRAGEAVDSAIKPIAQPVVDYLRGKAAGRASDAALAGQTKLNRELTTAQKRNVGETLLDEKGVMDSKFGSNAKQLAAKINEAEGAAKADITSFINRHTDEGRAQPSKESIIRSIQELKAKKKLTPDTKPYHDYLDRQEEFIAGELGKDLSMRGVQNLKNEVPWEPLAVSGLKKGRKDYKKVLQKSQDEALVPTGELGAYKSMQGREAALISAQKGANERANRFATNRSPSLTDYLTGGAGLVAGSVIGGQDGNMGAGAIGGATAAAALGGLNRLGRSRGSSASAANLNALSKMVGTKFGPILEEAASRGKGAIGVAHYLLYKNNPDYQQMYDSVNDGDTP